MNYEKMQSTLLKALRDAGSVLKDAIDAPKDIQKKTELSLVTEVDCRCEQIIVGIIKAEFPDHAFLTEEAPPEGDSPFRWIVDPIDGTTNFAHSYPVACVSIALEHDGNLVLGGVYDPFRDELFFAESGKGASLNGRPIRVSATRTLGDSLVATGFAYDRREKADDYLATFKAFMKRNQGMRRAGSAAMDLCYVACGRFDAFYEQGLQPWDKAAGMLIVEEAGGKISNYLGETLTINDRTNLASNGHIHGECLEILKDAR